jgi:hypothetical protein
MSCSSGRARRSRASRPGARCPPTRPSPHQRARIIESRAEITSGAQLAPASSCSTDRPAPPVLRPETGFGHVVHVCNRHGSFWRRPYRPETSFEHPRCTWRSPPPRAGLVGRSPARPTPCGQSQENSVHHGRTEGPRVMPNLSLKWRSARERPGRIITAPGSAGGNRAGGAAACLVWAARLRPRFSSPGHG